ncbi:toprim domain-containing protein, partial [Cetobacterium sp.]|uniref:toprim domain-containing protein n=1 Tax=Cetobacterium sp. TaxID=2071632 RepID=UPI003F40657C
MTVLEYINSKGWEYKLHGKEALLKECPFCGGKDRFNVNIETGQYICNRQNSCGAKGTFKLGDNKKSVEKKENPNLEKIVKEFESLVGKNKMLEYMKNRGISQETLKKTRVLSRKGVFCFFYTNDKGKAIGVKYRTIDEPKKIWAEKDSVMNLLNWDKVETREKLYIVEGEIDMMSFIEVGVDNVVSVPNGVSNLDWIDLHYEWLESFKEIILVYDNDTAGQTALKKTYERLNDTKIELKTLDLLFYKDPNEILTDEKGREKLLNIIKNNEKDIAIPNTLTLNNVKAESENDCIDTQDKTFNKMSGGIRYGEVAIFTGNAGSGKSTFVNNIMANLLNQGHKIYTHQGEFRPGKFKSNLYKIMCRPNQIETFKNEIKDKVYGKINNDIENDIDNWLGDRIEIHGSQVPSKNELIKTMEQMYKKKGIRIFFIDNLMTIQLDTSDKYEEQKQLFLELQAFVKKYNVFLGVVAHPKKNNADLDNVDQYVISGASEIINLA